MIVRFWSNEVVGEKLTLVFKGSVIIDLSIESDKTKKIRDLLSNSENQKKKRVDLITM